MLNLAITRQILKLCEEKKTDEAIAILKAEIDNAGKPSGDLILTNEEQKALKEDILAALNENYVLKAVGETEQDCIAHNIIVSIENLIKFSVKPLIEKQERERITEGLKRAKHCWKNEDEKERIILALEDN